ncbi:MAG TPA: hypothetical protein VGL81_06590 [Polyangiaceae bacterium]|jgi:hypothetical protein
MNAAVAVYEVYPVALRFEVRRAARLSHTLTRLVDRVDPGDAAFVWLLGRADEVRAVVGGTMREWQEGRLDERRAAERIGTYVRGLEESLEAFFGESPPPAASRLRLRPPRDTMVDR